jgi:hypothetical protein
MACRLGKGTHRHLLELLELLRVQPRRLQQRARAELS